jgi:hypothetical protein
VNGCAGSKIAENYETLGCGNSPPVGADNRSWREAIHRAMGAEFDAAKHYQRRKEGGLPKALSSERSGIALQTVELCYKAKNGLPTSGWPLPCGRRTPWKRS